MLSPSSGFAITTSFTFYPSGFVSQALPLSYNYYFSVDNSSPVFLGNSSSPSFVTLLPPNAIGQVNIFVQVSDVSGASSNASGVITLSKRAEVNVTSDFNTLLNGVSGPSLGSVQMAASLLTGNDSSSITSSQKIALANQVLVALNSSISSTPDAGQVTMTCYTVRLSDHSQVAASTAVLTSVLTSLNNSSGDNSALVSLAASNLASLFASYTPSTPFERTQNDFIQNAAAAIDAVMQLLKSTTGGRKRDSSAAASAYRAAQAVAQQTLNNRLAGEAPQISKQSLLSIYTVRISSGTGADLVAHHIY